MRSAAPALLPIFRSRLQADILAALLLRPDRELSLTDLATRLHAPLSTVHVEVQRLAYAGLLMRREAGRSVRQRPGTGSGEAACRTAKKIVDASALACDRR